MNRAREVNANALAHSTWRTAKISTPRRFEGARAIEITSFVDDAVAKALARGARASGVAFARARGARAAIAIANVRVDERWNERLISGKEDQGEVANAGAKAALIGNCACVPVRDGELALGKSQRVFLYEFDDERETRECEIVICARDDETSVGRGAMATPGRGFHLLARGALPKTRGTTTTGVGTIFIQDACASLTINENADPTVRVDMENAFNRIVPEEPRGEDASVKASLIGPSARVPISDGKLAMGTWQGVYLNEHRSVDSVERGHSIDVVVDVDDAVAQKTIEVTAGKRGLRDITDAIKTAFDAEVLGSIGVGIVHCFVKHTSASICVGAAGAEFEDAFEEMLNRIVPERWNSEFFTHTYEGPDDMPGHVKATLVGASVDLPVIDGELALDDDERVYLCEHRDVGGFGCGLKRSLTLTLQGSTRAAADNA